MSGKKSHRSTAAYLQYLKGEISGRERNAFERKMETDPFDKEALEGLEQLTPGQAEEDILALHARLNRRLARRRRIAWYSAAATVASLLIVGTIFLQISNMNLNPEDKALEEMEPPVTMDEQPEADHHTEDVEEKIIAKEIDSRSDNDLNRTKGALKGIEAAPGSPVAAQPEALDDSETETDMADEEILDFAYEEEAESEVMIEEIVVVEAAPADRGDGTFGDESRAASVENVTEMPEKKGRLTSRSQGYALSEAEKSEEPALSTEELSEVITGKVQGVVISAEDQGPLPGASVVIRGTSTGAVTDMLGQFSLPVEEDESTTLVASYIGMETLEQHAVAGSDVELVMQPNLATLDEVVVVGYGISAPGDSELADSYQAAEPSIGFTEYRKYIEEQIRFPAHDTVTTRAVVVLKFTVTAAGEITEVRPLRSPGVVFTEEATRLVREGPSWNPAINPYGITIDEEVRLRIVFKK